MGVCRQWSTHDWRLPLTAAVMRLRAYLAQAEWSAAYGQAIPHLGNFKSVDAERIVWLANEVRELEALPRAMAKTRCES